MLYLSNADVHDLLPMDECVAVMEDLFRGEAAGQVENRSRQTLYLPGDGDRGSFHRLMMGADFGRGAFGLKSYTPSRPGGMRYYVLLHDLASGALTAFVEAKRLGELRTGAAAGLATKYLAREDARTVGIIGTGREARAQLDAMRCVRPITTVKAYSRSAERREAFAEEMRARHGIDVTAVDSAEEAVRSVDIVITITSANAPVLRGDWLEPGQHVNAVGATSISRRELDEQAVARCRPLVVESVEQAREESGELIVAVERGLVRWQQVVELAAVVAGHRPGRTSPDQISQFNSLGVAAEDVASAAYVLQKARAAGRGFELPIPEMAGKAG